MSDFKAKMYQIQFRLGLCPRPRLQTAYSAPPDLLAALRGPTSKVRGGDETPPLHAPQVIFLDTALATISNLPHPGIYAMGQLVRQAYALTREKGTRVVPYGRQ